jgi:hypothetical protein
MAARRGLCGAIAARSGGDSARQTPSISWRRAAAEWRHDLAASASHVAHVAERLYPGDGDFPLFDFLRAAPRDQTLGIECPSLRRARSGVSAADQAKEAMAKLRRTMAEVN